jgi:hypothetical protein
VKSWVEQGTRLEKIEIVLTNCIKEIKSGKASLADCLNRYASVRQELEPLLKVALNIKEPQVLNLDSNYKQAAKARLLQQIRTARQKKSRSFTDIFSFGLPARFVWARVAVSIVVVVILVSMLAGGTAYAAQSSLPGDLLYPVKIGTEDVRLLIAGDSAAKAKLNLQFAQTRLEEMSNLAIRNEEKTELAVNGYQANLDAAKEQTRTISDTSSLSNLLDGALANIHNQMVFCDNVIDTDPKYLEPVREASSLTISAQVEFLRMLELQNIVQAAQTNLNAMQNRLQRAHAKAGVNQFQTMQEALLQYQQFNRLGEEILQRAQSANNHSTEIEALSLQALSSYLDTLNSIGQEIPQEYQNTIELCRQTTLQFQTQAGYRYQHQGDSGRGSHSQPLGNSGGSTTGQGGQTTPQYQGGTGNTGSETPNTAPTPSSGTGGETDSGNETSPGGSTSPSGGSGTGPAETPNPSPDSGGSTGSNSGSGSDIRSSPGSGTNSGGTGVSTGSGGGSGSGSGSGSGTGTSSAVTTGRGPV